VKDARYSRIQSVARAAGLLKAFVGQERWSLAELAKHAGLHKSVVHRLLLTLAGEGLLVRDAESGHYGVGPVFAQLRSLNSLNDMLKQVARPHMKRLSAATGETISLCVLEGKQGLCIDYIDSLQMMRFTVFTGETFPLNAGCVGKVMLAFQPEAFIEELIESKALKRYTPNTIVQPRKLRAELEKIRRLGYGFSDSEITPQSRSVGAPVYGPNGTVIASLVVSAPAFRMRDDQLDTLIGLVCTEAGKLSQGLGHAAPVAAPRAKSKRGGVQSAGRRPARMAA
jgi:DNA-binding IclR family transcriptional regulator